MTGLNKNLLFSVCSIVIICIGTVFICILEFSATRDLLPAILKEKSSDLYNPSSFKSYRDKQDTSFLGEVRIGTDKTFTFVYKNPSVENARSAVAFFYLDQQNVSFSSYDNIEIGITNWNWN